MTTGNRTVDARTMQWTSWNGNTLAGLYSTKVWSGTDWPHARPVTRPNTWTRPHYTTKYYYDASRGSMKKVRVLDPPIEVEHRTVWIKQPGRFYQEEHPYTCTFYKRFDPVMSFGENNPYTSNTSTVDALGAGAVAPPNPWNSNHDLELLGKLRTRVAGNMFDAGVAFAEADKTLYMIGSAVHRLARGIHHASRGNFAAAARVLTGKRDKAWHKARPAARNWLELQYGWMPLYRDVYEGAQFLAHHFNVPLQDVVRVTLKVNGARATSANTTCYFKDGYTYTRKTIKAILKEKDVWTLSGLLDPASIIWERIPFSFVVDWFLPIGDWLQARQLPQALTGTFVTSTIFKYRVRNLAKKPGQTMWYSAPNYYVEAGNFTRTVSTMLSVPLPSVKPLGDSISLKHAANALALLFALDRKLLKDVYSGGVVNTSPHTYI